MQAYLALAIPIVLTTLWLYTAAIARARFPTLRNKRICLLIAHPDDEAMFFAPTVLALTEPSLGNHVKILCLSSGNADGIGETRKKELLASASILGLRTPSTDVLILDDPSFPDSMSTAWPPEKVASILSSAFSAPATKAKPKPPAAETAPTATIDILMTFDATGISSHPNHISLYHGSRAWLASLMRGKAGWECPVGLYVLASTNIVRKYVGVLDAPFTMLRCVVQSMRKREGGGKEQGAARLMFLSDAGRYLRARKAMTQAHKSQMRWFRWGWIAVGRYMVVNDLRRERIV